MCLEGAFFVKPSALSRVPAGGVRFGGGKGRGHCSEWSMDEEDDHILPAHREFTLDESIPWNRTRLGRRIGRLSSPKMRDAEDALRVRLGFSPFSRLLTKAQHLSPLPRRQRAGRWRARAALRRTAPVRLRPTFGGYPAHRAPPCIWTILRSLGKRGFFSSLLEAGEEG